MRQHTISHVAAAMPAGVHSLEVVMLYCLDTSVFYKATSTLLIIQAILIQPKSRTFLFNTD